jgi:hypothetical protein
VLAVTAPRNAVFAVSGMHRSGTSFVASVLPVLGVSLGDASRLMRAGPDNPAGYFEVQAMLELNEELLARLGGAWDAPPRLDPGWETAGALDDLRARAARVVDEQFGAGTERPALIAFKDPRMSLLLPFWRSVLPIAATIVLVRDPREVAASLEVRKYSVPRPQAAGLWLRYLLAARRNDPGHLLVRYPDLFDALPETLRRIAAHLGVAPPDDAALANALDRLEPALRHQDARAGDDSEPVDPLTALADAVWDDGALDLDLLPPIVANAIAQGWLSPALDNDLLARARADVIAARETLRQRNRQLAALTNREEQPVSRQQPN